MKILHISDIHCTLGNDFNPQMFQKAVDCVNAEEAVDFIFVSGDLTTNGLLDEYVMAQEHLKSISHRCIFVPGNHDERNLGYKLFPEFFGKPSFIHTLDSVTLIGLASSEPDKDDGHLGRARHQLIEQGVSQDNELTIVGFHHHLIPVPNSGREKNIIEDAGETLDIILKHNIPLVLMGHRHVPYGVKLHNSLLINAGTFSCTRTRARFHNTFNIIEVEERFIRITVVDITDSSRREMIHFDRGNKKYMNKFCQHP